MKISYSTPLVNLKTTNGYGNAGKNIVDSLNSLGHQVPFQDPSSPVQLNFSQPDLFKMHRNQYQISYTPWESTVIPYRWIPNLKTCDEVWTTSDWCATVFNDAGFKDVKVYPHGINSIWKPYRRQESDVIKFLHIGEPAPRKAGQMAFEAFAKLFGNNPRYSLTIKCFNNNTIRVYNNIIDRNIIGIPDTIYNNIYIITEEYDDCQMVDLVNRHDVLIYPSYGEGFGLIPLQALATGMPVICTDGWAHYDKYLGPLKIKSTLIDSPWPWPHEGQVFEPNYQSLLESMIDVSKSFKAYSGYYFAQADKIHQEYNWLQLTKKAFSPIVSKFSKALP